MSSASNCLAGGGEAGERLRAVDWSDTPLGPVQGWPVSLQTAVRIVLSSEFPMMLHWGPEMTTIYNDAYAPSLGQKHPGHLGRPAREWWSEMWDQLTPIFDRVASGTSFFVENARYTPDRDGVPQEAYFTHCHSPLWDDEGRIAGIFLVVTETTRGVLAERELAQANDRLTEQNRALLTSEAALQLANQGLERRATERAAETILYRNIVDSTRSPICAYGTDQRVIAFNKAHAADWLRVMGYPARLGEMLPDAFPPAQGAAQRAFANRALAGEEFTVESDFGSPELEVPHWELDYAPIRDEGGAIIGAFHHARDVTERLRAEAHLREMQEVLRQSQKMEAVGQLTGGVAHDFNNLLTIIRSSVDFLRRPDLTEDRRQRYIEAVSETVDRAAKLTGQLLAFARRQALKPELFDVGARLGEVGEMLDTVTGSRIRVSIELPERPCFVRADVSQFETALVNMAVNARDAMDGEGRLILSLAASVPLPAIRGHAGSHGRFVAVSVIDTGSGIAADQLARIFEPFFTTKEVGKGTGLGLSQVFGFAKQSGGDVDVRSALGEGTTFTLYLPEERAERVEKGEDDANPSPAPGGAGQCVLVVEDNVEVGRFCQQMLEDLGYRTTWAANAEEALVMLGDDGHGFDAVFSDVVMPGMGGVALAETLRQRLPHLPVVLTSGYSHVLARETDHGFELLHKPYSAEQVGRVLHKAMARATQRLPKHAS